MKKILRIARLELSIMFYSPIAWLILIIFIVQTGMAFTELLYNQETNQQLGRPLQVLSKVLFAGEKGVLAAVQQNLYLYIPLLTMGLLSRETSSGSIKLLLSSPVTVSQIVLGKFVSMMGYALVLALVLLSFIPIGLLSVEALDVKFVLGGVLGIYLLICAYAAIGLFMSSLTTYQVVAAISTLAILAALNFVGNIGQQYDFVRDVTYWLSISGRTDHAVNGLLSSKDVIYFLLVIGLFLTLTVMKLSNERHSLPRSKKFSRYGSLIVLVIAIGYVTSLPTLNVYHDTTRFKDRTLTRASQEIVQQLDKPISITSYVNVVHYTASNGAPENRINDLNHFEKYRRFLPNLKMEYVYYYDTLVQYNDTTSTLLEKAQRAAKAHRVDFDDLLTPEQIKQRINLVPEDNRFVRFIEYDGKTTPLRMFDDIYQYPGETEVSAALKRLIARPALVGVLSGNGERSVDRISDGDYKIITKGLNVRGSLINAGFDVVNIALDSVQEIPADLEVLVLADPKSAYSAAQGQLIKAYIAAGGNVLFAGEPGRESVLNPLLMELGVRFAPGTLLQESDNYSLDLVQAKFTSQAASLGFGFYDKAVVTLSGASPLILAPNGSYNITPLLVTDPRSTWIKHGDFDLNTDRVRFDPAEEEKVAAAVAVALQREMPGKVQKIMVVGDADFMSNAELSRQNINTVNAIFALRAFKWFTDGEYPVDTSRPDSIDDQVRLTRSGIGWMKASVLGVIPLLVGLFGTGLLMVRKRK
ncbi:Gldg family protein [Pontibacter actiniarum]|uniref:ABC transporter n=1 Tax=Pontibacter actiniarum TaxID=323450 RepID=A0A1X9YYE7_9BACT|nr:Gldg family protein [Pontibacter actiniarum]ARS37832.1 ABC transporter [Pontibacter actiniarum]